MTRVLGLHHVTATVDDAQADLDFAVDHLGLRLVKKTVNFDNHHVYHFYYGDERGTPGTIWTTFPYRGHGVGRGQPGAGQIASTAFSVPADSLDGWSDRLLGRGLSITGDQIRLGERTISVTDASGLSFDLIGAEDDTRSGWTQGGVAPALAIRGLHSVTLGIRSVKPTLDFLTGFLGFEVAGEEGGRTRLCVNGRTTGHALDVLHSPDSVEAVNGLGTVHHVALAVAGAEEQAEIRERLIERGHRVTPIMDRQYFTSIYFREPGGVLLEIATAGPGFLIDEDFDGLGRSLKLPPWEEPNRAAIEAGLPQVRHS